MLGDPVVAAEGSVAAAERCASSSSSGSRKLRARKRGSEEDLHTFGLAVGGQYNMQPALLPAGLPTFKGSEGVLAYRRFEQQALSWFRQQPAFLPARNPPALLSLKARYQVLMGLFEPGTSAHTLAASLQEFITSNLLVLLRKWVHVHPNSYWGIIRYLTKAEVTRAGIEMFFYEACRQARYGELANQHLLNAANVAADDDSDDDNAPVDIQALEAAAADFARKQDPFDADQERELKLVSPNQWMNRVSFVLVHTDSPTIPPEAVSAMQELLDTAHLEDDHPTLLDVFFRVLSACFSIATKEERLVFRRLKPLPTDTPTHWAEAVRSNSAALGDAVPKSAILQTYLQGLDTISKGLTDKTRNFLAQAPASQNTLDYAQHVARKYYEAELEQLTLPAVGSSLLSNLGKNAGGKIDVSGLSVQEKLQIRQSLHRDPDLPAFKFCDFHQTYGHSNEECYMNGQRGPARSSRHTMAVAEYRQLRPAGLPPRRHMQHRPPPLGRPCTSCGSPAHSVDDCPREFAQRRRWPDNFDNGNQRQAPPPPPRAVPRPPVPNAGPANNALVSMMVGGCDTDLPAVSLVTTRSRSASPALVGSVPAPKHAPVIPARRPVSFMPSVTSHALPPMAPVDEERAPGSADGHVVPLAVQPDHASRPRDPNVDEQVLWVPWRDIWTKWSATQVSALQLYLKGLPPAQDTELWSASTSLASRDVGGGILMPARVYLNCLQSVTSPQSLATGDPVSIPQGKNDLTSAAALLGNSPIPCPDCLTKRAALFAFAEVTHPKDGLGVRVKGGTVKVVQHTALFDTAANLTAATESFVRSLGVEFVPRHMVINTSSGGVGTSVGVVPAGIIEFVLCAGTDQECVISPEVVVMADSVSHVFHVLFGTTSINLWGAMVDPVKQVMIYRPRLVTDLDTETTARVPMQVTAAFCTQLTTSTFTVGPTEPDLHIGGVTEPPMFALVAHAMQDGPEDPEPAVRAALREIVDFLPPSRFHGAPFGEAARRASAPGHFQPTVAPQVPDSPAPVSLPMPSRLGSSPPPVVSGGLRVTTPSVLNTTPVRRVVPAMIPVSPGFSHLAPVVFPVAAVLGSVPAPRAHVLPEAGLDSAACSESLGESDPTDDSIPAHWETVSGDENVPPAGHGLTNSSAPSYAGTELPDARSFTLLTQLHGLWVGNQRIEGLLSFTGTIQDYPDYYAPDYESPAASQQSPGSPVRPYNEEAAEYFAAAAQEASPGLTQRLRQWQQDASLAGSGGTDPFDDPVQLPNTHEVPRFRLTAHLHTISAIIRTLAALSILMQILWSFCSCMVPARQR